MGMLGKVVLSNVIELHTGSRPEGADDLELFLWFDSRGETLDSGALLQRSLWVSLAEKALERRDQLDLVVGTLGVSDALAGAVTLIARGVDYPHP